MITLKSVLAVLVMSSASAVEQDIVKLAIEKMAESFMDKSMMMSYVSVADYHGRSPPKMVTDILETLEGPKYTFSREDVTDEIRDHFSIHEHAGIAIWSLLEDRSDAAQLKNQLWTLDQNLSGFKRCLTVLIDEIGTLRKLFDLDKGRYQAPEKLHCHTVLLKPSR